MSETNAKGFAHHQDNNNKFQTSSNNNSQGITSSTSGQQVAINLGTNQNYQNYAEQREQQLRVRESIQKPM
jgi:hypothetical protein